MKKRLAFFGKSDITVHGEAKENELDGGSDADGAAGGIEGASR